MVEAVGSFKFARLWVSFRLSCRSPQSLERVSPSSLGRYSKVLFFRNLCPPQPPIAVCQTRSQAYPITEVLEKQRGVFDSLGCVVEEGEPDFSDADEIFLVWRA